MNRGRARWAALVTSVTQPPAARPRWQRLGRVDLVFAADTVIALLAFALTNGLPATQVTTRQGVTLSSQQILVASFALCAPLVLRTRYPLTAWAASALALSLFTVYLPAHTTSSAPYVPAGVLVYVLCLYAVAVRCSTWVIATAGIVTVVGGAYLDWPTTLGGVLAAAIPLAAGVFIRSRRGSRERLEVAERRHEGERALLEERQRIARELHDVVAHHMSVIAIQAEAAPYKTADPPQELVDSFAEIRSSALSGLNELRRVLGVLRSDKPDVAPQPGLEDLDRLLESARTGGVTVSASLTGTPRALPGGVDLSAYRIVQEALSNAIQHASGSAVQVGLHYGDAALVIEVRSSGGAAAAASGTRNGDRRGGHGIIGMRERAAMLGGHLSAGPVRGGEFLVVAALPLDDDHQEARG